MGTYNDRQLERKRHDADLSDALTELGVNLTPTAEWRVVIALLRGAWPGELTQSEQLAYLTVLNDLPERDVANAVKQLSRAGRRYRPTPGEIREQLEAVELADEAPTFTEAWALIEHAGRSTAYNATTGLEELTQANAAVGAWVTLRGLAKLWREPTECPQYGRLTMRDLRQSYEQHCEAWRSPQRRRQLLDTGTGKLTRLTASQTLRRLSP